LIRSIIKSKRGRIALAAAGVIAAGLVLLLIFGINRDPAQTVPSSWKAGDPIKWVDFDVPCSVMEKALKLDVASHAGSGQEAEVPLDWVEMLSYLAAKYGGDFRGFRDKDLDKLAGDLRSGVSLESLTANLQSYPYYYECYNAVLGGMVGPYRVGVKSEDGGVAWEEKYGLKAFSPLAGGFSYTDYDDFGAARSYGYSRPHLGHDMMADVGTPIIAIETGIVEELGWNQYGGWRVGLRSLDGKRYYYYAHMRKDRPYAAGLSKGQLVYAGDVIGYVGRTGYSTTENVNNVKQYHLHWGMRLIFDETQKDDPNEIWVNVYEITKLLQRNKSQTVRDPATKEYTRAVPFEEPPPETHTGGGGEQTSSVELPVIMYHSLLNSRAGQNKFTISPGELEADLKYLSDNGWHTVVMDDLIRFVENGKPLPDKPILLTFDDGYYNNVYYAEPMLHKYGMRGVLAVVGAFSEMSTSEGVQDPNYSYVSWNTLSEVAERGVFDIQSHTYGMHERNGRQGCLPRPGESPESYRKAFMADNSLLLEKLSECNVRPPTALVYPFGAMSVESEKMVKEAGYKASLSCTYGVNILTPGDPECLYQLKRVLRSQDIPVSSIIAKYCSH